MGRGNGSSRGTRVSLLAGEEKHMLAERGEVVRVLRSRGDHDRALQAECRLPRVVDLDEDAGVLSQLDVEVSDVEPRDCRT
jgi:hypothetical protein